MRMIFFYCIYSTDKMVAEVSQFLHIVWKKKSAIIENSWKLFFNNNNI